MKNKEVLVIGNWYLIEFTDDSVETVFQLTHHSYIFLSFPLHFQDDNIAPLKIPRRT